MSMATTMAAPSSFSMVQPTQLRQPQPMMPSTASLLTQGNIISERVVNIEECYGTGLVRAEGEIIVQQSAPPIYQDMVTMQPEPVIMQQPGVEDVMYTQQEQVVYTQSDTVVVQEDVIIAPVDGEAQVAQSEEQPPQLPVAVIGATSGNMLGDHPTGAWLEEIAGPFFVFQEAGCEVHLASTAGGPVPIDEASTSENFFTDNSKRFLEECQDVLNNSLQIGQIAPEQVDCVFLAGGHGVYADFEPSLAQFVTDCNVMGKVVGAVCHGPVGLLSAIAPDEAPLIAGRTVTGFTDAEEQAVGLDGKVPFLLQSRMMELGAQFQMAEPFSEFAVADGNLITGQNPQSSVQTALLCVEAMRGQMSPAM
jgi:putative intracellular protease/amidase